MRLGSFLADRLSRGRGKSRDIAAAVLNNKDQKRVGKFRNAVIAAKVVTSPVFWSIIGVLVALIIVMSAITQSMAAAGYAAEKVRSLIPFVESGVASDLTDEERDELMYLVSESPGDIEIFDQQIAQCIASSSGIGTIDPVLSAAGLLVPPGTERVVAEAWILYVASTPEPRALIQREDPLLLDAGERQISDADLETYVTGGNFEVLMFPEFEQEFFRLTNSSTRSVEAAEVVKVIAPRSAPERFLTQVPVALWSLASQGVLADSDRVAEESLDDVLDIIDSC